MILILMYCRDSVKKNNRRDPVSGRHFWWLCRHFGVIPIDWHCYLKLSSFSLLFRNRMLSVFFCFFLLINVWNSYLCWNAWTTRTSLAVIRIEITRNSNPAQSRFFRTDEILRWNSSVNHPLWGGLHFYYFFSSRVRRTYSRRPRDISRTTKQQNNYNCIILPLRFRGRSGLATTLHGNDGNLNLL